jgi:hypothetical protein
VAAPPRRMTRSWLLNAALLIIVVALGWFVYLKPRSDVPAGYPLSSLRAGEARTIRLDRSGQAPIALEKKDALWFITAPFAAPAEPFQIGRLLSILDARASNRLAATDLARFDLDRPVARLTVDSQTFSFGAINTVSREQYVLTGNTVYPVELRYGAALPADVTPLVRRQLFAGNEVPLRFEFSDFTVASADGKWSVVPAPADLSQDDINRWVDDWRLASALHAEPYAKGKAVGAIKVEFKDGRKITLDILQREPELVLLRPDQNLQYSFFAEIARRLLSPPGQQQK